MARRPCTCDRIPPEGVPWKIGQGWCSDCTLYHRNSKYQKAWSEDAATAPKKYGMETETESMPRKSDLILMSQIPSGLGRRPPCVCQSRKIRCDEGGCELGPIGVPFDARSHCKTCWLWHNDETIRVGWGGKPRGRFESLRPDRVASSPAVRGRCRHLGEPTGAKAECQTCQGKARLKLHACSVFGDCTIAVGLRSEGKAACFDCTKWQARPEDLPSRDLVAVPLGVRDRTVLTADAPEDRPVKLRWAIGVTTVPQRSEDLLPRTLASLEAAGFGAPRLFVDGWSRFADRNEHLTTVREPRLHCAGNWLLALAELWLRDPTADRWAIFQDDLIACRRLRAYLDACPFPERGYLNLYTFASNQERAPKTVDGKDRMVGWYRSNQLGRGALGLVFDRAGVIALLGSRHVWARNVPDPKAPERRTKAIDGGIVTAMQEAGWAEWVHNPSLIQHTGDVSTVGNLPHAIAPSFRGEGFDAMELIEESRRQMEGVST